MSGNPASFTATPRWAWKRESEKENVSGQFVNCPYDKNEVRRARMKKILVVIMILFLMAVSCYSICIMEKPLARERGPTLAELGFKPMISTHQTMMGTIMEKGHETPVRWQNCLTIFLGISTVGTAVVAMSQYTVIKKSKQIMNTWKPFVKSGQISLDGLKNIFWELHQILSVKKTKIG